MLKKNFSRLLASFRGHFSTGNQPPRITDDSTSTEITAHYPQWPHFLRDRYGLSLGTTEWELPLKGLVERHGLPPARILFMELQMSARVGAIRSLSARQAHELLKKESGTCILDVRESWELASGLLPGARPLDGRLLEEIVATWPKQTPVLLYCHFGVRSLDAAAYLADQGFSNLFTLSGGIDAWSQQIDDRIPRYTGSWC